MKNQEREVFGGMTTATSSTHRLETRITALTAAASFLGQMSQAREEIRSDHVLILANKWLAWLEQEGEDAAQF